MKKKLKICVQKRNKKGMKKIFWENHAWQNSYYYLLQTAFSSKKLPLPSTVHTYHEIFKTSTDKITIDVWLISFDMNVKRLHILGHCGPENLKNSRQKILWNQRNQKIVLCEIAFLAFLNIFPVQKLIFGHFWNCKKWILVTKFFFVKLIYLISRVFLA